MKINQKGAVDLLLVAAIAIVLIVGGFVVLRISEDSDTKADKETKTSMEDKTSDAAITNFDECVAAGNPVMESFPEQCMANGETFVNDVEVDEEPNEFENDYFSVTLPEGWVEVEDAEASGGAPEAYFEYTDNERRTFGVSVNTLGFGGFGNGGFDLSIVDGMVEAAEEYSACDAEADLTGGCTAGNGSLLLLGSHEAVNGNEYLYWLTDSDEESQEAYQAFIPILESIEFN